MSFKFKIMSITCRFHVFDVGLTLYISYSISNNISPPRRLFRNKHENACFISEAKLSFYQNFGLCNKSLLGLMVTSIRTCTMAWHKGSYLQQVLLCLAVEKMIFKEIMNNLNVYMIRMVTSSQKSSGIQEIYNWEIFPWSTFLDT